MLRPSIRASAAASGSITREALALVVDTSIGGRRLTEEYLAGVVAQAKNIPAKLNNILRLHFCQ